MRTKKASQSTDRPAVIRDDTPTMNKSSVPVRRGNVKLSQAEQLAAHEREIQAVRIAIARTEAAQVRARETLDRLYDKMARQKAELRFQNLMLSLRKQSAGQPQP